MSDHITFGSYGPDKRPEIAFFTSTELISEISRRHSDFIFAGVPRTPLSGSEGPRPQPIFAATRCQTVWDRARLQTLHTLLGPALQDLPLYASSMPNFPDDPD